MDDGVVLTGDEWGDGTTPAVILAHGGGQTRFAWRETAAELAKRGWRVLAYDQRGHGDSGWSSDGDYRLDRFAADLKGIATELGAPPVVVGASLGGVSGLVAVGEALKSPFRALVLVDVAPQMRPAGVEMISGFMLEHLDEGFVSLEEAAEIIAAYQPHRRRPSSVEGLERNLRRGRDGRYRWHWDPSFVIGNTELMEIHLQQQRLEQAAANIRIPTLLIRGAQSELITEEAAHAFLEIVPHAVYRSVPKARHMVAGDVNDAFTIAILDFLVQLDTHT